MKSDLEINWSLCVCVQIRKYCNFFWIIYLFSFFCMLFVALAATFLAHTFNCCINRMRKNLLNTFKSWQRQHIQRQLQRFARIFRRRTIFGWIELYLRLLLFSLLVMHCCWLLLPLFFPFFIKPHRFHLKLSNEPGFSICSRKKTKE